MSKHIGRGDRWYEVSNTCYTSLCGRVVQNPRGKWDAIVKYRRRREAGVVAEAEVVGEFRRAREAMMAVEDRAVQLARGGGVLIDMDDSLTR